MSAIFEPALERAREDAEVWRQETESPGLVVALVDRHGNQSIWAEGLADASTRAPLRPDHWFQWGSITKSITALVALTLHASSDFDIDAPIASYLPWFQVGSEFGPILVRQLLSHTGGIVIGADMAETTPLDVWLLRETHAAWEPGTGYWYSNAGYKAVGLALEVTSGEAYPDLVRRHVLEPLGMASTSPVIDTQTRPEEATGHRRAELWREGASPGVEVAPWVETSGADGSVVGAATDLCRYLSALLAASVGINGPIKRSAIDQMTDHHIETQPDRWYGYGLRISYLDGRPSFGHGGEMLGFRTSMTADPETGTGAVVFSNLVDTRPIELSEHLLRVTRAVIDGIEAPKLVRPSPKRRPKLATVDTSRQKGSWQGLVGDYVSTSPWRPPLRVLGGSDGLVLCDLREGDEPLVDIGRNRFRIGLEESPEEVVFDQVVDGIPLRLTLSGHPYLRR